ncbi:variant erythrocyte surface antigen-1 family protein [Babesia caballi]|uniref:Variant erythrocyte surface antigen-1 family protein n=1 Tax=Babesia caballi TaxID=5871 RepID=A0AAV4LYM7_BABCB|nr:variant erythrocyte surface antigen-1 family protein [Babesia caballi]
MATGKTSLTEPPENLKETIDWVIKIKNDQAIKGLAEALKNLLDKDGSALATEVNGFFATARSGLKSADRSTAREAFILKSYLNNITHYGRTLSEEEIAHLKTALEKDVESPGASSGGPISKLADGLKMFVGKNAGIGGSNYESSYKSASESWSSLNPSQHRDCALILLGIMPLLYFGLSYLYWWCSPDSDSSHPKISWAGQSLTTDQAITKFLVAFGYTNDLNASKNGQTIATQLQSAFSQLQTAYTEAKLKQTPPQNESPSYPQFLGKLQEHANDSLSSTDTSSPLTSLYLLSYYYITYPTYDVQSTSPATPSFLGYSGTAALAGGAYGFNLGGLGTFMSALLA